MLAGWLTGRWDVALPLAVFLELFWLDVIRLGAIAPPSGAISFLLLFSSSLLLALEVPGELPLPLMLCVPCAYAVSLLERRLRERTNARIDDVAAWCAGQGGLSPSRVVLGSLARQAAANGVLFLVCFALAVGTLYVVRNTFGLPVAPGLSWNVLYGLGLLGAVLALRTRRAYVVLGCALILTLVLHF